MSDLQFSGDTEVGRLQKQRNKAMQQALASLKGHVIGADRQGNLTGGRPGYRSYGKVRIWHNQEKKWLLMRPVDAAELLAAGAGSLDGPPESEGEGDDVA